LNSYDPIEYWKEAGKTYYQDFKYNENYDRQETELVEYLYNIKFDSVLELGCGFGRITELIYYRFHPKTYVAVDVSKEQLSHIKIPRVVKIESDIESFKTNEKFDLVIAVEVLMHQLPDKVQSIVDKMKSLSKKHVISIDYTGTAEGLEPHNFKHLYPLLYKNVKVKEIGQQCLFHYELE